MADPTVLARLEDLVSEARAQGSPVASEQHQADIARFALRRWRSFNRRHPKQDSPSERMEDLAKGLAELLEPERSSVGRLMTDYRWLAEKLSGALREA